MLLDTVKPVALLLSILSLYAVFHAAFLTPAVSFEGRLPHALLLLTLAAGIALPSGLLFQESATTTRLSTTLPIRTFTWSTLTMALLFLTAWYLQNHCILYRDPFH